MSEDATGSASAEIVSVGVGLGARSYAIEIGPALIHAVGERVKRLDGAAAVAVVTDRIVAGHHLAAVQASLDRAGVRSVPVVLEPGEGTKSYAGFAAVCDALLAARLERGDIVLALGGGVVGDLAGFAAATLKRGMRLVQVPTSLLAQVDSSVGGKTAINTPAGKNLVGVFHQPSLVLADTAVLDTLSPREFRAGYAEVVKYGLIDDLPFFAWLEQHRADIFAGGPARTEAVARSCRAKAAMVARDEFETGDRALLNLGHTFGHALERLTAYDGARLVHGEGVAIGMALAFRFSRHLGLTSGQEVERVQRHLVAAGLPTRVAEIPGWTGDVSTMLDAIGQDKKVQRGRLTFILARGIGQSFVARDVAADEVATFLTAELAG